MTVTPIYVLTTRDGFDTIHRDPSEECTDGAEKVQSVDPDTGEAIEKGELARRCAHCYEENPS